MVRIIMDVHQISPFLRTFSGEIIVHHVDFRNLETTEQVKELLKCKFDYKPGQVGFKNISGFSSYLFHAVKPQLDVMLHSYASGMNLAPHDFSWIQETNDKPLEEWLKEKEIEYEASDEFQHLGHKKIKVSSGA